MPRPKLDDPNTLTFDPGTIPPTGWEEVWHNKGMKAGFEQGVDAGRKWGHEEKDEEWRERIRFLLATCTWQDIEGKKSVPVEDVEALL